MLNRVLLSRSRFVSSFGRMAFASKPLMSHPSYTQSTLASNHFRMFSQKVKTEETPQSENEEVNKEEKQQKEEERKQFEEEEQQEFHHDESNDAGSTANFSTSRRILFALGKLFKYSIWSYIVLFFYHFYLVRKKEKPEESFGCIDYFLGQAYRAQWHCTEINKLLTRPPVDKLLPDIPPLPPGAIYPKTLVIGLRGITVKSEYKLGVGFEYKKRPGLNSFIQKMSQMYEVVLFGEEESTLVQEIGLALDPDQRILQGAFGHESTLLKDGRYIKDLSYMNRDVKKIVCIDFDPEKFYYHQDNVIKVPEWDGDMTDRHLVDIVPFLAHLATHNVDARSEIKKFGNEDGYKKFQEVQNARRDMIAQKKESGFGGMLKKFGNNNMGQEDQIDENKLFSSQFKSE